MREIPQSGDIYRHFKNKLYQIIGVAIHSETNEELVIYQALYGDFRMYARPLSMFMSKVDREKYPEVTAVYRFEKVDRGELSANENQSEIKSERKVYISAEDEAQVEKLLADREMPDFIEKEDNVDERLLMFLEAENFAAKLEVLNFYRNRMDDKVINAMAASLDTIVPEGDVEERFKSLRNYVSTQAKFECNRFR